MTFYETMAIVMNQKGIRAVDICRKTGLSSTYMTHLKKGHMKDITWEKALAIIKALDMTPDEFLALQESDNER